MGRPSGGKPVDTSRCRRSLPTICRTGGIEMVWRSFACLLLLTGAAAMARAQMPFDLPKAAPQDGASLFANQCGTCHTTQHDAPPRQGPNLAGVYLRKAGAVPAFHYSPGFARAGFVWDDAHLD